MIYNALNHVSEQLNEYLMRRFSVQEQKAILGSIVDESGAVPVGNRNKVILSLVNLEPETIRLSTAARPYSGGRNIRQNPPCYLNVDLLVSSLFTDYHEALKFLDQTIYFFQSKPVFTRENAPGLDPNIEKLTFEMIKLDYNEIHNLWATIGTKYIPSVLFKVRTLSFQSGDIEEVSPLINKIDKNINLK